MPQSIVSTLNQPIIYSADNDATCKCGERENCILVAAGQQVYSQLKISPCGDFEVCNNSLGAELVTNGNFTFDASGWTLDAGLAWNAGAVCASAGVGSKTLDQAIAITNGLEYYVVYSVAGRTAGNVGAALGGTAGTPQSTNDTFAEVITAGAGGLIEITGDASFDGCIDSVSVKPITNCWDADGTDWITSATGACHETGNTTDLTSVTPVVVDKYYHVIINVSGSTAGGINVVLGNNVLTPVTSGNGTFHFWGEADGVDLIVRPTADFDGCISGLDVDEYCNEYKFHLVPASGDEFLVVDLTALYNRFEDTYNLSNFKMSDLMKSGVPLPYGCYKFCLVDCCTEQQTAGSLLRNGDFAAGGAFWTAQGVTFAAGAAVFVAGQEVNLLEQALISTHDADCIELEFGFSTESPAVPISIFINGVLVDQEVLLLGGGFYTNTFSNVPAGAVITFTTGQLDVNLFLDDITVTVPEDCQPLYDQCTPCINYQASFQCTKLVEGFCDGNALGFAFTDSFGNNQFKLSLRAKCDLLHPSYDQEQEDYDYSTGDSSLSYGQSAKFQALTFFPLPEYKHDVIALEKVCDTFQIDAMDYFVKKGDYIPEWNRNTSTDLAPSRIDVKKKNQALYNTNCS